MQQPHPLESSIPRGLLRAPRWVVWRYEQRGGKATKPPFCAADPMRYARADDPATWASFDDALTAWESTDGVEGLGFVVGPPYIGLDLDHCFSDGELHPRARKLVDAFDSWTYITPSGDGLRIFIKADPPEGDGTGRKVNGFFGPGTALEVYWRRRHFCVTADRLQGTPLTVRRRQRAFEALYAYCWPETPARGRVSRRTSGANSISPAVVSPRRIERALSQLEAEFAAGVPGRADLLNLLGGSTLRTGMNPSQADWAAAKELTRALGRKPRLIEAVMRQSKLPNARGGKYERRTYLAETIHKAMAEVGRG